MINLERMQADVAAQFQSSNNFVAKKTRWSFSSTHIGQTCIVKGGGATELIENPLQVMRSMVVRPEMVLVIGEFDDSRKGIREKKSRKPDIKHLEQVHKVCAEHIC